MVNEVTPASVPRTITTAEANRLLYAEIASQYEQDLEDHRATMARDVDAVLAVAPTHEGGARRLRRVGKRLPRAP